MWKKNYYSRYDLISKYIKTFSKITKYLPSKVILTQNMEHVQRNFPSWRPWLSMNNIMINLKNVKKLVITTTLLQLWGKLRYNCKYTWTLDIFHRPHDQKNWRHSLSKGKMIFLLTADFLEFGSYLSENFQINNLYKYVILSQLNN